MIKIKENGKRIEANLEVNWVFIFCWICNNIAVAVLSIVFYMWIRGN